MEGFGCLNGRAGQWQGPPFPSTPSSFSPPGPAECPGQAQRFHPLQLPGLLQRGRGDRLVSFPSCCPGPGHRRRPLRPRQVRGLPGGSRAGRERPSSSAWAPRWLGPGRNSGLRGPRHWLRLGGLHPSSGGEWCSPDSGAQPLACSPLALTLGAIALGLGGGAAQVAAQGQAGPTVIPAFLAGLGRQAAGRLWLTWRVCRRGVSGALLGACGAGVGGGA